MIRRKFTCLAALTYCYLLLFHLAGYSQNLWHETLGALKTNFPQLTGRIATHGDFPQQSTNFLWNDSLTSWDTIGQTTFTYVPRGGLSERISYDYNGFTFDFTQRETHHYDQLGNDSMTVTENWNGASWIPSYRFLRNFDAFGNIIQSIGNTWTGVNWDTSSGYRATFTYHNIDQIASSIQETYTVGVGWTFDYKMIYQFDSINRWDTITSFVYNQSNWVPDMRLLDIGWHDFQRNMPDSARFEKYNGGWENFQRFHVSYSQFDNQIWIYEKFGVAWDETNKYIFHYDQNGHEILNESYDWIGVWLQFDGAITHYAYDVNAHTTEVWQEIFDGYIYRYNNRQTYSNFFVGIQDIDFVKNKIVLFPNPANEAIHLQLPQTPHEPVTFQIYNLQGILLVEQLLPCASNSATISLPEKFVNGIYVYKLTSKSISVNGKFCVQK